jgi:hypothetical protein
MLVQVTFENGGACTSQTVLDLGKVLFNQYAEAVLKVHVESRAMEECWICRKS